MIRLLLLLLSIIPVSVNAQNLMPPVDYTVIQSTAGAPLPLQNLNQNQGIPLGLGDDSISQPINLGFEFTLYDRQFTNARISNNGVISFDSPINGCCSGFNLEAPGNNYSIFALQTDLLNMQTVNPWYKLQGEEGSRQFTVGWYDMAIYADSRYRSTFEVTLYEYTNNILLNYGSIDTDNRWYTVGIKGDNSNYEIIYNGSDSAFLDYTSYTFLYLTQPIEPEPTEPEPVNCTLTPSDPTCIINNLVDTSTTEQTNNTTETQEISPAIETQPVATTASEPTIAAETQQELVAVTEERRVEEITPTIAAQETTVIREIANEERATTLSDNISVNVLELALSVADNAVSSASANSESSNASSTAQNISSRTSSTTETTESKDDSKTEQETTVAENTTDVANELLDTGRQLNNLSLAATQIQSEQSANDSTSQAENVAVASNESKTVEKTDASATSNSDDNRTNTDIIETNTVAMQRETTEDIPVQISSNVDNMNDATVIENTTTTEIIGTEDSITIAANTDNNEQTTDIDVQNNIDTRPTESNTDDEELIQTVLNNQNEPKTTLDDSNEDEKVTIQYDTNLVNIFNVIPNINNLEQAGMLNNKQEDKSDAEKQADKIVAANAKEQEEINNNYMDADQSGILGIMTADTDVSSYRSTMIKDNNLWYKPEDIYKNKVYKDNVRGMYFLEKGNTDTYKKMVDEQYGEKQ